MYKTTTNFTKVASLFLLFLIPFLPVSYEIMGMLLYRCFYLTLALVIIVRDSAFRFFPNIKTFIIYAFLSIFPMVLNSDWKNIFLTIIDVILPFYIGYYLSGKNEKNDYVFNTIIISGIILSILGIIEAFTGINSIDKIWGLDTVRYAANDYRFGIARCYESFGTSIDFALYLSLIVMVILYKYFDTKKKAYLYSFVICFAAIITTLSRGIIAPLLCFFLLFSIHFRIYKNKYLYVICFGICFAVIVILLLGDQLFTRAYEVIKISLGTIFNSDEYKSQGKQMGVGGAKERLQLFYWVFNKTSNWFIGNGYSSEFSVQVNEWKVKTSIENYYLYLFYCSGVVGGGAFLFLLSKLFLNAKNKLRQNCNSNYFFRLMIVFFSLCILTVSPKSEVNIFFLIIGLLWRNSQSQIGRISDK